MSRYDWPSEFTKSPDRIDARAEQEARAAGLPTPPGLLGDLDDLDDVIQRNFDEDRLWLPLGPSILINGQARGNPIVSGRVRGLAVSDDGQRIYVGAANGGLWHSADAGVTWEPLGSWGLSPTASRSDMSLTIGALLVAFGAARADDVVYAATGEALPRVSSTPGSAMGGIGILRLNGKVDAALAAPGTNPWRREGRNLAGAGVFRLARNPAAPLTAAGAGELVAATSNGLWTRSGAFVEDADWRRISFAPTDFDANDGGHTSDVVWNDRGLWVTLVRRGAEDGLYRSVNGTAGPFARITLPGHMPGTRLTLAPAAHDTRRMYVLGLRPPTVDPANNKGLAALWLVDLAHSAAAAVQVANFPVGLFTSTVTGAAPDFVIKSDQAAYDQAMVVGRDGGADVVTVGGSTKDIGGNDWNASLFRLRISGTAAAGNLSTDFGAGNQLSAHLDATYIGAGVHADIHALTLRGADLWIGCDGGVFLLSGGVARSMNAGLATAEPGYIASHPDLDGPMLAGTQDNGAIQRVGNTVWQLIHKSDGGGCAYHPTRPHQTLTQNTSATWYLDPPGFSPCGPALRSGKPLPTREKTEDDRAQFYSAPAVARSGAPDDACIFIGTDRIWHSRNWRNVATPMTWVTIPTGTDPWNRLDASNNIEQDRLGGASEERVLAIRMLQDGNAAQNLDGMAILVLTPTKVRIFRYTHPVAAALGTWTAIADSVVSDPSGVERPKHKSTDAEVPNPFLDRLPRKRNSAWTDIAVHRRNAVGTETFYVTTTGSVVVNDDGSITGDANFDTLWWYNGAGRWYPAGLRNTPLDPASGTGGCPLSAHSVVCDPVAPDIVYVGTRIGVWEGRIDTSGAHPSWVWKPAMEGLPQALVEDLHVKTTPDGAFLRAALVARGVWERNVSAVAATVGQTFLRSLSYDTGRTALPVAPRSPETDAPLSFHESPDVVLLTTGAGGWGAGVPNEAELLAIRKPGLLLRGVCDAYVMVHHRHMTPVPGANVNIDLFLLRGAPAGAISGVSMAPIRQAILDQVRGAAPAFPAGFSHVGRIHPAHPVDARNSRAARTTIDLSFPIVGAGPDDHAAVIAVVTSPGNPLADMDLAGATLEDVVRATGRVAVRKVRRL
ncbi:MAG: hypothetical protein IOD03_18915 [Methylocystis sp.]|nr:hypothetical protein [Rhodobacter sp.]MCA3585737.1 hypothetical protein [Methylocystis sp.]MCA6239682.1 hypothetical protein [Phenylobacterium sp.]